MMGLITLITRENTVAYYETVVLNRFPFLLLLLFYVDTLDKKHLTTSMMWESSNYFLPVAHLNSSFFYKDLVT